MKVGVLALLGVLLASVPLRASNPCPSGGLICIEIANGNNAVTGTAVTITTSTETVDLSPYTGTISQTSGSNTTTSAITLYCDDLNNNIGTGTEYNMNITHLGVGASLAETQFDTGNPTGTVGNNLANTSVPIPAGTTLYEEEAWLYTQIMDLPTGAGSTANVTALQEAAWEFTSNNLTTAEETNANPWLTAAYYAVTGAGTNGATVDGVTIHAATYSDWYVFTDPASANDATSTGYQEFLAYSSTGMTNQAAPEPATFWLFGSALILGGVLTRRKARKA